MTNSKTCPKCNVVGDFHKDKSKKDGLRTICKVCARANADAWHVANPTRTKANNLSWLAANPDRAAGRRGKSNATLRAPNCVPSDYELEKCIPFYAEARRLTSATGVLHHVDHITALTNGGLHHADNLQVLTAEANVAKRDK